MQLTYIIPPILLVIAFMAGYQVANYRHDSLELVAQKAAQKVSDSFQDNQQELATDVIKSLDDWKNSNRGHNETIIREKEKPVFLNSCVSPEYIELFNAATGLPPNKSGNPSTKTRGSR